MREIFASNTFKNVVDFRLFLLILGQAMFKEGVEVNGIILERGEWLRSFRQLQKDLEFADKRILRQYGIGTIKRSVDRLIAEQLICTRNADSGTVFKVVKYDEWQGIADFEKVKAERIAEQQNAVIETKRNKDLKDSLLVVSSNARAEEDPGSRRVNFYDAYYMNYGRMLTPNQLSSMNAYMDQDGLSEELVCFAIDKAARVSSHHNYLNGILNNWLSAGIRTVEQAQAQESSRREKTYGAKREYTEIQEIKSTTSKKHKYSDIGLDW